MQIFKFDSGSYLGQMSAKVPATVDKEKMDKYLQTCLESRRSFTPMVYSMD